MKITGAIFDFDGTLFDSMPIWHGIRDKYFDHIGIVLNDDDKKAFEGIYLRESLILAKERFHMTETYEELFESFFDYIKIRYLAEAAPKNDIVAFLDKLQARGVRMGIATATGEPALKAVLEKFGMLGYFSEIISIYTVGVPKTEPKVYDVVREKLGTDKETTWVFEDAFYAAKTAKAAGYPLVAIYDASEPQAAALQSIADAYIHNYEELVLE